MKKGRIFRKILTVILLFAIASALLVTVSFATVDTDYSKPGSVMKAELTASDILSLMLGEEISQVEREYLELYSDFKISHASNIPSSQITVRADGEEGKLFVKAEPYSYVAENGAAVIFVPEKLYIKDSVFTFTEDDGEFFLEIDSSQSEGEERVRVIYSAEIEISCGDANSLINKAYYDASDWKKLISDKEFEYVKAKAEYAENKALYEKYAAALAEYEILRVEYEKYLSEKLSYDRRLAEYTQYLSDLSAYEGELKEYENYLAALKKYDEDFAAYQEYLYVKENYGALLEKYEKYERDIAAVRYQISIIDGLKNKSTSLERSIYSAVVIGTAVTEVIENKDLISNGVTDISKEVIDLAGESTENIRQLCIPYFELETEAEKYAYYVVNYEGFRSNFTSLFKALDNMYLNSYLRTALREQGKQEKYEILLAQLYYVVNALNDGPVYNYDKTAVYDSKYVINTLTKRSPLAILDNVPYVVDKDIATPVSTGYPTAVEKPSDEEIPEPSVPTFVSEPAEPYPVLNPGNPPAVVPEPDKPKEVKDPGQAPQPYIPDPTVTALISAFENGGIPKRNEVVTSVKISHKVEVYKTVGDAELVIVKFLNNDGTPICDPILVEKGTYADFPLGTPVKESDAEADYKFAYWVNSLGERCDLDSVNSDLNLYPYFEKQTKSYKITWKIGNSAVEEFLPYGEIPAPPENPKMPFDQRYEYVFDSWDKEISAVSADTTYRAVFKQKPIFPTQNGSAAAVIKTETGYLVDCGDSWDFEFNLSRLFEIISDSDFLSIKSPNTSITLSPEAIAEIRAAGALGVKVNTEIIGSGYAITVLLTDESGSVIESVSSDIRITLAKAVTVVDVDALRVYYLSDGKRKLVKASYEEGLLYITVSAYEKYYVAEEYSIGVLSSGGIGISVPSVAKKGEKVRVTLSSLPEFAVLDEIYYLDSEGKKVVIEGSEFVMPDHSVIVGAHYHIPTYVITFVADGKVIFKAEYKRGDKVVAPQVPDKASDSRFYYTYGFWTPTVTDALADATYEAKYVPSEIVREDGNGGLQISEEMKELLARIFLIVFFVVAIVVFVSLAVFIVRRRTY